MALDHFHLTRPPFNSAPDPAFHFEDAARRELLGALQYALRLGDGVIKVTGESGSGKTMLCNVLAERLAQASPPVQAVLLGQASPPLQPLRPGANSAALFPLSPQDAVCGIARQLGLAPGGLRSDEIMRLLQSHLTAERAAGRQAVLLVEESQGLPLDTLETLRQLTNLSDGAHPLLPVVLIGTPELSNVLRQPRMRQLRERITLSFVLPPLPSELVPELLAHRLRVAGHADGALFQLDAAKLIARTAGGDLHALIALADKSLNVAAQASAPAVAMFHVRDAIKGVPAQPMPSTPPVAPAPSPQAPQEPPIAPAPQATAVVQEAPAAPRVAAAPATPATPAAPETSEADSLAAPAEPAPAAEEPARTAQAAFALVFPPDEPLLSPNSSNAAGEADAAEESPLRSAHEAEGENPQQPPLAEQREKPQPHAEAGPAQHQESEPAEQAPVPQTEAGALLQAAFQQAPVTPKPRSLSRSTLAASGAMLAVAGIATAAFLLRPDIAPASVAAKQPAALANVAAPPATPQPVQMALAPSDPAPPQPAAVPTVAATAAPAESPEKPAADTLPAAKSAAPPRQASLLKQSLQASKTWLRDEPDNNFCVQIENFPASESARAEKFLADTRAAIGLSEVHSYPMLINGERRIAIVYGSFASAKRVMEVQTELAERSGTHHKIRTIKGIRQAIAKAEGKPEGKKKAS